MAENKVKFGLKNVHYAVWNAGATPPAYATPVAIPGAVALTLAPEGEDSKFYADDVAYYLSHSNTAYTGNLEVANLPDSFFKDVLGEEQDATAKTLSEIANVEPKKCALLFEVDGDQQATKFVYYNCLFKRPSQDAETKGETTEPKTTNLDIEIMPDTDGLVKTRTTDTTPTATLTGWYSSVFKPTL